MHPLPQNYTIMNTTQGAPDFIFIVRIVEGPSLRERWGHMSLFFKEEAVVVP